MYKKLQPVGLLFAGCLMLAIGCQPTEEISLTPNQEILMPDGILVFPDGPAFSRAIEQARDGDDAFLAYAKPGFKSQAQLFHEAQLQYEQIMASIEDLYGQPEAVVLESKSRVDAAMAKLVDLKSSYEEWVVFEEHMPNRLKYHDPFISQLVDANGLVAVGETLLRYSNNEIRHVDMLTVDQPKDYLLGECLEDKGGEYQIAYREFAADLPGDFMARRVDTYGDDCLEKGIHNRGRSYTIVNNTFDPIWGTEQVWIENNNCYGDDCVGTGGGYWVTRNVIVGYTLVNTHLFTENKTYRWKCILGICTEDIIEDGERVIEWRGYVRDDVTIADHGRIHLIRDFPNPSSQHGTLNVIARFLGSGISPSSCDQTVSW
ncbi:MAG TPA: hypothetical protein DCE41_26645 [Cytophagales bacterium]|nr:hypothetical protein [Cytophagales bacterium]HAA18129.1 hypothetical protein [Cytophagales bacterium]HAP61413.1 hypothetical protein [Cytophagales bacterium]